MDSERRDFLKGAGAAAAGCAAFLASGCHTSSARLLVRPAQGGVVSLKLTEAPELAAPGTGIRVKTPSGMVLVWRDDKGVLRATSIGCPHMGCDVEVAPKGTHLYCPCHKSEFEVTGSRRAGPAKKGLRRYEVREVGGELILQGVGA